MQSGEITWPDVGYTLCRRCVEVDQLQGVNLALDALISRAVSVSQSGQLPDGMMARYERSRHDAVAFFDPTLHAEQSEHDAKHIHRLGHGLHEADPTIGRFLREGPLAQVAKALIGSPVKVVQSVLMIKQPQSLVQFDFHTDGVYIISEPDTLVVAWLALDPCDEANGTIRLLNGSHNVPPVVPPSCSGGDAIVLEPGDAAFWGGDLWHGSEPNRSARARRGLIAYYVADASACRIQPCRPGR